MSVCVLAKSGKSIKSFMIRRQGADIHKVQTGKSPKNTTLSVLIWALEAIATIVWAAQTCADQIRAARIKASEIFQLIDVSRHKWTLADACASKQWKDQLGSQCWSYWWILVDHVIIISFIGSHSPIEHSYMYLSASSRTVTLYIKSVFEMIAVPSIIVVVI